MNHPPSPSGETGSTADDGSVVPLWSARSAHRPYLQAPAEAGETTYGPAAAPSAFPAIADYVVLSDCENTCLVAPGGAVEWLCLPRPHDPSVFGTLLDRSAGSFRLGPADTQVPASRRYLPGTKVLETTWQTRTGWLVVTDFLAVGPWHRTRERSALHRRTPGDFDADHVLIRIATCVYGSVETALDCEPSFDYGRTDATWEYTGAGYDEAATTTPGPVTLRLAGDLRLGIGGRAVHARHRLQAGESCYATLGWGTRPLPADLGEARESLAQTERFWREWLDAAAFPDHAWREPLQRSALTLKALTYTPTGALLAASTTSLPEQPGGERNWDYRYTWIRDASFTLWALHGLGLDTEADDFLAFLADTLDGGETVGELQVLYGVDGAREAAESLLDHLSGYDGSRPVRIGNAAYDQDQHDIYGAVVDCVYQHTRGRDALSERSWRLVQVAVEAALARWRLPDRGIWEVRGEPRHFTHSKVMCWVAADRGARLAALRGDTARADRWRSAADEIHADVLARAVDASGRLTQSYGSDGLDASLLLLPLFRFLPPDDPRLRATVLAIADELTEDGLVLRYRTETTDDGLEGDEGSFLACSFWLVSALAEIGEGDRARALCERLLAAASPLGLYAEELSPRTGRHLGNFPQALTHLALINAVLHVVRAEQQAYEDGWHRVAGLAAEVPGPEGAGVRR
ncbi:glycoside hydrolase family 15 protein [Streptomyces sp. NBC_00075]|uniref:glycoside hydrolase family 15 protein n=1 Tax=Streptomyces sp. NBC_00075 TaxID=2975641 RepID=UPI003245B57A